MLVNVSNIFKYICLFFCLSQNICALNEISENTNKVTYSLVTKTKQQNTFSLEIDASSQAKLLYHTKFEGFTLTASYAVHKKVSLGVVIPLYFPSSPLYSVDKSFLLLAEYDFKCFSENGFFVATRLEQPGALNYWDIQLGYKFVFMDSYILKPSLVQSFSKEGGGLFPSLNLGYTW